jgi:hypothetical protein
MDIINFHGRDYRSKIMHVICQLLNILHSSLHDWEFVTYPQGLSIGSTIPVALDKLLNVSIEVIPSV